MSVAAGVRLGAYEIVSLIGSGGMGEVYRARDPRLGRDVAIKVLPAAFSGDPDRLHRFEQEARAAAALNHPNIIAVYDIGTHERAPYIVSELLEGQSLRERLRAPHGTEESAGGAVPVRKAIDYAVQAANGLAAAHEKGIVHRDLKPENLFITSDGRMKILDFGLAKLTQTEAAAAGIGLSTVTSPDTQPGVVMGTFGYMSPEQVRGASVDHRSDIFAFGTILYEVLAGRHAFRGESVADTMSAILREDPADLPVVERHLPPALARIVDRCLEKNPAARFQSTKDLAFALESLSAHTGAVEPLATATAPPKSPTRVAWTVAAVSSLVALTAIAAAVTMFVTRRPPDERPTRFSIEAPRGWAYSDLTNSLVSTAPLAVSPDGWWIAFVVSKGEQRMLYIRARDTLVAQLLPGTEGVSNPFWSPDSRYIGFFATEKLKKIDVTGGLPVELCSVTNGVGGAWGAGGVILFAPGPRTPLQKVSSSGGLPTEATTFRPGEISHSRPSFLPDGRHFLYRVLTDSGSAMHVGTLDSADRVQVLETASPNVRYASGHLLFMRDRTLMAQPFDVGALKTHGDPVPVAQQIRTSGAQQYAVFSASDNGVLAYQQGSASAVASLVWFDRKGTQLATVSERGRYADLRLSPDGTRAAVSQFDAEGNTRDIWIVDLARGVRTRFTSESTDDAAPVWSPDGSKIAFSSRRKPVFDMFVRPVRGAGDEQLLLESSRSKIPVAWSPDGRVLMYAGTLETPSSAQLDLFLLPVSGQQPPTQFMPTPFTEVLADISPDGRWVAYTSTETGRSEVYVAPFAGGAKVLVSSNGGTQPRWRRDGKELFYLTSDERRLLAAAVNGEGSTFTVDSVEALFEMRTGGARTAFDPSPDGKRILAITMPADTEVQSDPITVMLNWPAALKK